MKEKKIALLLDVDNVKIGADAFDELYQKLLGMGDVVYCKFYGYNDRKHIYLSDVISQYGYETAPFMRFKKRFSQLDTRMIVDAVRLCYTKPEIDTYCIVAGEGDLIPLLVELKSSGKTVVDVNTEYQEMNTHMFDEHITLSRINSSNDAYSSKAKKVTTTKTKTTKTKTSTPSKVTTTTTTKTYTKQAPAKQDYYEETVYDNDQLSDMLKDIPMQQKELAKEVNVKPTMITAYKKGKALPSMPTLLMMISVLQPDLIYKLTNGKIKTVNDTFKSLGIDLFI